MHQILDSERETAIPPLLRLGFRPFFLLGAGFSVLAMLLWWLQLTGHLALPALSNPLWWHAHEMLFGFGSAIVAGFLLTAVQNWTGFPGVRGAPLGAIVTLWLVPRLLLPLLGNDNWLLMACDLLWLPLAAFYLARPMVQVRQWRNLFFVPLLLVLTLLNASSWWLGTDWLLTEKLLIATVLLFTTLIAVMGGRVIPFFTSRATQTPKAEPLPWLERIALSTLWLLMASWILLPMTWLQQPQWAVLYGLAALAHLLRQSRWQWRATAAHPLLWSLHLAYLFIPLGLAALGWWALGGPLSLSTASHFLSVGTMGGMILAMMARVSLGHTGRSLVVGKRMVLAFVLLLVAALLRAALPLLLPAQILVAWHGGAWGWILAYGLFVWCYLPILSTPRADGRPG
ncbi:Heme/copper membrane protein [Aeromonas diversa CDC 2478-85]|uniref:Heme/copper membrane protein n=1 Tax=Aeromonas diversa CDC 2478-85 TaxID=1268237 RepID=N9TWX8_9GAMM|nr:NnrS family protein [Aeromonas diversa]ENY70575.1 Heme/copper membrane protein [Aeromonas diversa CDC 2478-85]